MDSLIVISFVISFVGLSFFYILASTWLYRRRAKLPPGPYPFPVIGNLFEFGKNPNQSLAKLARTYGNLMSLKLWRETIIVVSSPAIAKEVLIKNDLVFSSRPIPGAVQVQDYHKFSMLWLPTSSAPWRNLRKITKEYMFTAHQLDVTQSLRQKKFQELHDYLVRSSSSSSSSANYPQKGINIGQAAFTTSLNLISNTLFSIDFASYDDSNSSIQELKDTMWGITEIAGRPNIADYFPFLGWMDLQGIKKESNIIFRKMFNILENIIKQRQQMQIASSSSSSNASCSNSKTKTDLLDALIDHMSKNKSEFNQNDMKYLLFDIFVAGTDTTSATIEWAMAEILRNPKMMAKARAEIDQVMGSKIKERIDESDIPKLPYLQAIVKETFRLHPIAPLLVPHKADSDIEINGYMIPKDAKLLVNIWASGRDAKTWSDPETFCPERFLNSKIEAKGQHFELIPFGAGRRLCPGLPLAYRMVPLLLATFLHGFDWKLPDGKKNEDINMEEKFGLVVIKKKPLIAIPIKQKMCT